MSDPQQTAVEEVSSTTRRQRAAVEVAVPGRLCLTVIGEGLDATYPLPDAGTVALGRSEHADIRIDHRSVSRTHAILTIGGTIGGALAIEDAGSRNGTRVRDVALRRAQPVEVAFGEPIDVGSVMVVIQRRAQPARQPRHVWAHGYFEARLEEECARAGRAGGRFAVMRIHCGRADLAIEPAITAELRPPDVIGYYGPGEYEAIVLDRGPEELAQIEARLRAALGDRELAVGVGVAHYPADARDPYALLRAAGAAALGQRPQPCDAGSILVSNPAMQHLDRIVQRVAAGTISVLITGETGVGKEVLAERLHRLSPRADRPFLRLNCAALSESLLESELFGHERGAFTGAAQAKPGLLETAHGGTVFLDEIGELPMTIQVKLLRVIEERTVLRVGALQPRVIDVRFLAATHRDLEAEIARGAFRQDLYFRLNGISLVIPPLRQRQAEMAPLARTFLTQAAARGGRAAPPELSREALALMQDYAWPGNIRELRNVMERAALLCSDVMIGPEHLPTEKMRDPRRDATPAPPPAPAPAPTAPLDERQRIIEALAQSAGNQTEAAKRLGIARRTLITRLIAYRIPRPRRP